MTNKMDPKQFCASVPGANSSSEMNASCQRGAQVCLSGERGSYRIDTKSGSTTVGEQSSCFRLITNLVLFRDIITGGRFTPKGQKSRASAGAQPTKPTPASPKPTPQPPATPKAQVPTGVKSKKPTAADYSSCVKVGPAGSAKNDTCKAIIDVCEQSGDGPFNLNTSAGLIQPANKQMCLNLATTLASFGYTLADQSTTPVAPQPTPPAGNTPPAQPPAPKPPAATSPTPQPPAATPPAQNWAIPTMPTQIPGTKVVKNFADSNIRLRVTGGEYTEIKRTLHFEGGKGLKIKLKYSIKKLTDGRYWMNYTVFKGKKPIGGEQSVTFSANGGKINLAFEINLMAPNNFGSVTSISIVDLG